jgi:hypothetical protein
MNRVQTRSTTIVPRPDDDLAGAFGQVLPALVVMPLAVAYMEEDGLALLLSLLSALASLAITAGTISGNSCDGRLAGFGITRIVQVALRIRSRVPSGLQPSIGQDTRHQQCWKNYRWYQPVLPILHVGALRCPLRP